jgi:hypothetical protein
MSYVCVRSYALSSRLTSFLVNSGIGEVVLFSGSWAFYLYRAEVEKNWIALAMSDVLNM